MGRYTQHFVDTLDLSLSPLEFFCKEYPDRHIDEVRQMIGRFGISGTNQTKTMELMSDGIKCLVAFAQVAKEIWECRDKKVTRFPGDIMEYKAKMAKELEEAAMAFEAEHAAAQATGSG
ncbi:ABCF2 [Symbiodinium sp. KB8]|nr:ABCF2 [Symbiodinium sp. KB8]